MYQVTNATAHHRQNIIVIFFPIQEVHSEMDLFCLEEYLLFCSLPGYITSFSSFLCVESSLFLGGGTLFFVLKIIFRPGLYGKSPQQRWSHCSKAGMECRLRSWFLSTLIVALFYFQFFYLLRLPPVDMITLSETATWIHGCFCAVECLPTHIQQNNTWYECVNPYRLGKDRAILYRIIYYNAASKDRDCKRTKTGPSPLCKPSLWNQPTIMPSYSTGRPWYYEQEYTIPRIIEN